MVFQYLKKWTTGSSAKTHVEKYEKDNDGRAAWLELLGNYEGPNTIQVKVVAARQTINNSTWSHDLDNYKFEDYCKRHQRANNLLKKYDRALDGDSAVHSFLRGIHRTEYMPIKSYIIGNPAINNDLQRTIEAFKQQMIVVHNYPKDQGRNKKDF
jgi:hypothetical protein